MNKLFNIYRQSFSGLNHWVWLLSFIMLINRAGSMVLVFLSLYLTRELGFSLTQTGAVLGFFGMGSIAGNYLGGWLTDKYDYFTVMFLSLLVSGFILLFLIFVKSYEGIIIIVTLYSLVADIFRPANSVAIGEFALPANKTRSFSLMRMAINLGFTIGPAIGGFVALYAGYNALFLIDACTSFSAAILIWVYLPRKKAGEHKQKIAQEEKGLSAYKDKVYLTFIVLVAFYAICFFQLFTSLPLYFSKGLKYSEDVIGLLLAFNGALIVLIEMPIVHHLEKGGRIFKHIAFGSFLMILAFCALLPNTGTIVWPIIFMTFITFSEIFAMPFMVNFAISRGAHNRQGQYMALYGIAYGFAHIFAPMIGLQLADSIGFIKMFVVFAGLSLILTLFYHLFRRIFPSLL